MRDRSRLLLCLLLLLFASCEERGGVVVYDVEPAAAYDWPETEAGEGAAEGFVWQVPAGFVASSDMPDALLGDYRIAGATQTLPGRLTVSMILGEGGGLDANVQRWVGQMITLPPRDLSGLVRVSPELPHPWGTVWIVNITGQYAGPSVPTAMLAAVVRVPDPANPQGSALVTWFIKLTGDRATVAGAADAMTEVIYSLRPEGAPMPELNLPPAPGVDPHAGVPDAPPMLARPDDAEGEPEESSPTDGPGEASP